MRRAAALGVLVAALFVPTTAQAAPADSHPWDRYNLAPASRTVQPRGITGTTGTVTNPGGVLHGQATTLTGTGSSITLDFGEEVGGLVSLHFADSSASGQLGLAFSESSQYIGRSATRATGVVAATARSTPTRRLVRRGRRRRRRCAAGSAT